MGRLISFVVIVIIIAAKYFIFGYLDQKKIAEEIEKSKTVWDADFKAKYMTDCTEPGKEIDPSIDMQIYCVCEADRTQAAAVFPTAYNADEMTAEQYGDEVSKLSNAYYASELGKKNTDECLLAATKRL